MIKSRTLKRTAALAALALLTSACGLSLQALPKPGGLSGNSYQIKAVFSNVLNLPIQARVLIGANQVGEVAGISTHDFKADLVLSIKAGTKIPVGTTAQILFVDPLGDEFIQLHPPTTATATSDLKPGATLPETDTDSAPSIADTLAALGTLLNGGGLNQLETIVTQANQALNGHQSQIRTILTDVSATVTSLNQNTPAVDAALANLATLSTQLAKGDQAISTGLDTIGPAVAVLANENSQFNQVLASVNQLSNIAESTVNQSSNSLVGTIKQFDAILNQMVGVESQLGPTLTDLSTFEQQTKKIAPGNYLQLSLNGTAVVEPDQILGNAKSTNSTSSTTPNPDPPGSNPSVNALLGAGLP
jgi:phospholipid/cholesterol/gamma-HCH transport system substrate-binding protein